MTEKRKGARSTKDIPSNILAQLNAGEIETANLVEWLAIDQQQLLENLLKQMGREHYLAPILSDVEQLKKRTVNTINEAIGTGLFEQLTAHSDDALVPLLANHPSDVVRCWACYLIGKNPNLRVKEYLEHIHHFAGDTHFGVREIAWMAVRPIIAKNLAESLDMLSTWTSHPDPNIRRFASESTRPRGVWCEHIEILKQQPELGLVILEPLKTDKAKYVQDSVGNWLNDASKTQPQFVTTLCKRWATESTS